MFATLRSRKPNQRFIAGIVSPLSIAGVGVATALLMGCDAAKPKLVKDEGLSKAFSAEVGMPAYDMGLTGFSFICDGVAHRVKVNFGVATAAEPRDETVWSTTPCSESGEFLRASIEGSGKFQFRSAEAYSVQLVVNEWRKTIAHRFGSLAYNEPVTALVNKEFSRQLADLYVNAVDMSCDPKINRLRYLVKSIKPSNDRYPNVQRSAGETSLSCPASAETGHPIVQINQQSQGPLDDDDTHSYRAVVSKGVEPNLVSQFLTEAFQKAGRQQSF